MGRRWLRRYRQRLAAEREAGVTEQERRDVMNSSNPRCAGMRTPCSRLSTEQRGRAAGPMPKAGALAFSASACAPAAAWLPCRFVLRNWVAHSAIQQAEKGEFGEVRALLELLRDPFSTEGEERAFQQALADAERQGGNAPAGEPLVP